MSLYNDYSTAIMAKQHHRELLVRAAEDRLARQVPRRTEPWWRRLIGLAPGRPGQPLDRPTRLGSDPGAECLP